MKIAFNSIPVHIAIIFKTVSILLCSAVSWNDTSSSYKAVLLTGPIVRFLAAEELLTSSIASNVLLAVLQGLQIHGQHETNQVCRMFIQSRLTSSHYFHSTGL